MRYAIYYIERAEARNGWVKYNEYDYLFEAIETYSYFIYTYPGWSHRLVKLLPDGVEIIREDLR